MSGSAFFDALSDPGVGALLGAAQGFAQAAMPSRMPVPWGAAIGMGGAGALQGAQASQRMQLAQQQVKQAQIANQRGQIGLDWYKSLLGPVAAASGGGALPASPGTLPATPAAVGPSAGGSSTMPNTVISGHRITDENGRYLVSPSQLAQMGNLSLALGDPSAASQFYGHIQTAAGGAGYAMGPGGTAFAVPGGGKDTGVIQRNAAAEAEGKLPAELAVKGWQIGPNGQHPVRGGMADPNYIAQIGAAKPFTMRPGGMHWDAVHGSIKNPELEKTVNPDGSISYSWMTPPEPAWSGVAGQPGAPTQPGQPQQPGQAPQDPFPEWAQRINQAENATGNPAARNPNSTAEGNGQFIDQTWLNTIRSARPDLAVGKTDQQLMALRDNPAVALEATTQYAKQNAATFAQAGLPVTPGTVYLGHALGTAGAMKVLRANPNTPLSMLLPQNVIQANPQYQNGATAGDAIMWAQRKMGVGAPSVQPPNRQDGQAAPVLGPDGQPALAEMSPGADEALKEYQGKDADAYEAAQNTKGWITQVLHASDVMTNGGPKYWTGPYAPERLSAMANANDLARTVGLKAPFDQNAIASWEEMKKATITAGFELSSHYEGRARQAASVIENATNAVPAEKNSPVGLQLVSHGILEGAQAATDLYDYKSQLYKTKGAQSLVGAEDEFYKRFPPSMYAERAISTVHPVRIDDPSQFNKYLPGTFAVVPAAPGAPGYDAKLGGKLIQVPNRTGAPEIPRFLMQQPQPQQTAAARPAVPPDVGAIATNPGALPPQGGG